MSGPVWRFEAEKQATCSWCLVPHKGVFVEGDVQEGELQPQRVLCEACFSRFRQFFLRGEGGSRTPAPAYAHR